MIDPSSQEVEEPKPTWAEQVGRFTGYVLALPLAVVIAALILALLSAFLGAIGLVGWAIYQADPGELTPDNDAGYLDLIITNRWVVWALRGGLIAAFAVLVVLSIFVVISIAVRARRGEWLRSGAGLHTDIRAASIEIDEAAMAFELLAETQREKEELAKQLQETTDLLDFVLEHGDAGEEPDAGDEPDAEEEPNEG
jgi:hypothetical protein